MDSGEYISTMENMDSTLAELGDEFTLGDIDGEWFCSAMSVLSGQSVGLLKFVTAGFRSA